MSYSTISSCITSSYVSRLEMKSLRRSQHGEVGGFPVVLVVAFRRVLAIEVPSGQPQRTWVLRRDFSRAHNVPPRYIPMSILNMALLSVFLIDCCSFETPPLNALGLTALSMQEFAYAAKRFH